MDKIQKTLLAFQKDEMTSAAIYSYFAKFVKDEKNKKILKIISEEETAHAAIWEKYTGKVGYTFVVKALELHEFEGIEGLDAVKEKYPETEHIISQEQEHERQLIAMLDEERLNYVGAMVLGLNDALVELTGTIAGLTFVLMNTTLIAMAGIITGISATLSMAASNYLAERADGNPNALKASIYTGLTYLMTVVFLVLPYLILPENMFLTALFCMIGVVVLMIFVFNYYIAVVKTEPFWKKFFEMSGISLSVALIAFLIGLAAKTFFGIDVG